MNFLPIGEPLDHSVPDTFLVDMKSIVFNSLLEEVEIKDWFFFYRFPQTPLGIKAVVVAIYEPPQECSRDHIRLIPDENEGRIEDIAKGLGLKRIGWIFTDLVSDSKGVKHTRKLDTHFLSSQECIMAGYLQNKFPNATKLSSSGKHGSKFVTVVVTGNAEREVHMEGYQVYFWKHRK